MNQDQLQQSLAQVKQAVADGKLSSTAAENIRAWLSEARYAAYAKEVAETIAAGQWQQLDDVFWTVIPFGTGGRRGRMFPVGSNAINDRTIGESAEGLADYVKAPWTSLSETGNSPVSERPDHLELSCAIAYDTRH